MIIAAQVGPTATKKSLTDGLQNNARLGNMGGLITSELHGRYYESAYRNTLYNGAATGVTTSVGLATTYTGLVLSNPLNSPVNLVIDKVGYAFLVAFTAAAAVGLMIGQSVATFTHTTPVTPRSSFVGSAAGYGLLDSAATLPVAPTISHIFAVGLTGAITTVPGLGPTLVDLEGSLVLPPGAFAAFYTSTASGAAGFAGSFMWEENPV